MKSKIFACLLIVLAFCLNAFGQMQANNSSNASSLIKPSNTKYFPIADLKEGMKGTAWTVFSGEEPEEFNVEILGVVPGAVGPKLDMIVGRISGGAAERTAVFAGMSGSPVYINGKLVGAIAYSFPFSKEAICGITPIEQMIGIFEKNKDTNPKINPGLNNARPVSQADLNPKNLKLNLPTLNSGSVVSAGRANSALSAVAGQTFQPIATPISFNGISQETLNHFAPQLAASGLLPVASIGGAAKITPLKKPTEKTLLGGKSVVMQLARGDYSMAASGTVTLRDGNNIYAFGHPFMALGVSDLPMSESHVITVVPSINNSFKLAVPDALVGRMSQDRSTGVFGDLGQAPSMIPVELKLITSRNNNQKLNFEIAKDDSLTPLLMNIAVYNSIGATERGVGNSTIDIKGEIKLKNQNPIKLDRRFSGMQATQLAALSVALPVNILMQSNFKDLEITKIDLNVTSTDKSNTAALDRIAIDKSQVKAGGTIEVEAFIKTETGELLSQKIPVQIPAGTPSGTFTLVVGDGDSILKDAASRQFTPKDLSELVKIINDVRKDDRLYVQIYRETKGAIIGANEMPNLPPSVLATLNNDRTSGGVKPSVQSILLEREFPADDFVLSGQQTLTIEVIK